MDLEQRIENFKKMTSDDPENELGHFSLGKAYLESGQHNEAAQALARVLELNPDFSKAYQLLAEVQTHLDQQNQAILTLKKGYEVASRRGDVMPRDAMGEKLRQLGLEPPEVESAAVPAAVGEGQVQCCRCGQPRPRLPKPPYKTELGSKVFENVCAACWREWVAMGTKVINELQLDFAHPQAAEAYDAHMKEFLQLPD